MATTADAVREYQQFIGGQWTAAASGKTFDDKDPFTGETVAVVPAGGSDDARKAIEAAATAFPAWAATSPAARQAIFLTAADILESRRDEVVSMLARETGCTFGFGMFQMHFVPGLFRQAAAAPYQPIGQIIPSDTGALAMGIRKPVGVVGAIAPWNAALILSARSIAAPLALGNTVVLKPSEWSPWAGGLVWGEIFAEAGLPEGVLNIVTHAPGKAGDRVLQPEQTMCHAGTPVVEESQPSPGLGELALPAVNAPERVMQTTRDGVHRLLSAHAGVRMPATIRIRPRVRNDVTAMAGTAGLGRPFLVREPGSHGGTKLALLGAGDRLDVLDQFAFDGREYYVTEFVDFRSPDGIYRKYRVIVIDGVLYPRHLVAATTWNIHAAERAELMGDPAYQREEEEFLRGFMAADHPVFGTIASARGRRRPTAPSPGRGRGRGAAG